MRIALRFIFLSLVSSFSPIRSCQNRPASANCQNQSQDSTRRYILQGKGQETGANSAPFRLNGSVPNKQFYDWQDFRPKKGILPTVRWFITGQSSAFPVLPETKMLEDLTSLARLLILLREYEDRFGMPAFGSPQVQRKVVSDILRDLYSSGAPSWVLEPVMERVSEGLTGKEGVQFAIFPRKSFVFFPGNDSRTELIKITPGFHMDRLGRIEKVAVRLASFASNTQSVERLGSDAFRTLRYEQFTAAKEESSANVFGMQDENLPTADELAEEILNLASETYGLFFFLNSEKFQGTISTANGTDTFWLVKDSTRELFSRLAAKEASDGINKIHTDHMKPYSSIAIILFRIFSAAGASAMWFGGSLPDMLVAGGLAVLVSYIEASRRLVLEERLLTEVVSSFVVGLVAGLLSVRWPDTFCFGAIAVASVMDLLQGFKVVFGLIEVMSRNVVTGSARILEGLMFTGLISYNLTLGLDAAFRIIFGVKAPLPKDLSKFLLSTHAISNIWYPLILPFASIAWSGLFRPNARQLPLMMFHGMLAFALNTAGVPSFLAAMCVTFSSGVISRFTGREALGNTLAGLYALVPGAYMVRQLLSATSTGFLESVLRESAFLGLGAWTGTLLCSPTILGKTSGFHGKSHGKQQTTLLYF